MTPKSMNRDKTDLKQDENQKDLFCRAMPFDLITFQKLALIIDDHHSQEQIAFFEVKNANSRLYTDHQWFSMDTAEYNPTTSSAMTVDC